jgi:predicted dehydrogenase
LVEVFCFVNLGDYPSRIMNNWTRKEFLKASLITSGAALLTRNRAFAIGQAGRSANGDIRIGIVGFNAQGFGHLRNYLPGSPSKLDGAVLAAICDVDDKVLAKGRDAANKAGLKVAEYKDYRKMFESKEIDAVVCAPPNHQHSIITIAALMAGKDVYIEKPLSHNIWEGRQAVEAARKYSKNIALIGTQNRSSEQIMNAIAALRAGKYGKLKWVTGTCYKPRDSIGLHNGAPQPIPEGLDYDLWSGPAPLVPSTRNSPKNGPVHYDWHWFWNYGGGDISNQGIHQMDVSRWMLGAQGLPKSVQSFGGRFGYRDDAETPNTLVSVMNYDEAPLIFEVRGLPRKKGMRAMDVYRKSSIGVVAQCEHGYINVSENGSAVAYDNDGKRLEVFEGDDNGAHRKNWIKALRSRKVEHGILEEGHYSTSLCHLANISYLTGAEKSNAQLADAVASNLAAKEAYWRTLDHLKANEVDLDVTKPIVGPVLQVEAKTEMLTHADQVIADAANNCPIRKRTGRAPFVVPDMQHGAMAKAD